jgi:hypothetical protein
MMCVVVKDRLQLFKTAEGSTAYKLIGLAESQKLKGLSTQDRSVYQLISDSSNMGIILFYLSCICTLTIL